MGEKGGKIEILSVKWKECVQLNKENSQCISGLREEKQGVGGE